MLFFSDYRLVENRSRRDDYVICMACNTGGGEASAGHRAGIGHKLADLQGRTPLPTLVHITHWASGFAALARGLGAAE